MKDCSKNGAWAKLKEQAPWYLYVTTIIFLAPLLTNHCTTGRQISAQKEIESERRVTEAKRILAEHYLGKNEYEQLQAIGFMLSLYPEELSHNRFGIVTSASSTQVLSAAKGAMEAIDREKSAYALILDGKLGDARSEINRAVEAFPAFSKVKEMQEDLLPQSKVDKYERSSQLERDVELKGILLKILKNYSEGMPVELRRKIERRIEGLK